MKELLESKTSSTASSAPPNSAKGPRPRESSRLESVQKVSPISASKLKPVSSESNTNARVKRSILPNKARLDGEIIANKRESEVEGPKIVSRPGIQPLEQYAHLRRRSDTNCRGSEDEHGAKANDLQKRLDESEITVKELHLEVLSLKAEVEKLQSLNVELQAQKKKLANDFSAAEVKIAALERLGQAASVGQEGESSELRGIQKLIANKLDQFRGNKMVDEENINSQMQSLALKPGDKPVEVESNISTNRSLQSPSALKASPTPPPPQPPPSPPPPPPPPPHLDPSRENKKQTATALVEFYNCFTKRDGKNYIKSNDNCSSPAASSVHNSIVGELQNRSAHLLAIKADVETKREFINHLVNEVKSAAYSNMDDLLTFVNWLDGELSKLADERAVLKHFNWPERKADSLREAAIEYRDIKQLHADISSFEDDASLTCDVILKKIANLIDRSERYVQRVIRLRGTTMITFQECKIPTEWMLDSGMVSPIKLASVKLAKLYIMRLLKELEFTGQIERGSAQESLLSQGVRFAYRVYQFAGGLDSETMRALEKLRNRIQWRESRELIQGLSFY